ncbi:amidohydrolase [Pseudoxanthomonas sp. F37]|uniref:amidohydrolase n=1 Tax=Pseudoxanthomonas TaxID=83618 RepID=UPI001FD6D250|nr:MULTISPECIES: amidohydrolase [Pseudoxanthomonas]UOV07026.1 amidohydrolase [Pseudoxanthomonas mexicana]UOV10496.1 amidohydrolase [Pseudoxanthomonas sp. F37]
MADLILRNARITTLDATQPSASAIAFADGRVLAVGDEAQVMAHARDTTRVIDAGGRRLVPGLNDSHTHLIRGGLNYNLELRWDGVRSLADAMAMLKAQVAVTPAPQWVRVVGGFSESQFAEKRLPTLDELNAAAPDTPVFILHLYDRALLNRAALRAVGYTKDTPDPPGGEIQRDKAGHPTGLLLARPNALILYATLAMGPRLPAEYQLNSTRHFMRELNRLGITSVIDAGGGFQNYPEDYRIIEQLHAEGQLTVRIAYNLFTQKKGEELADFQRWSAMVKPGQGDDLLRHNGAGEMLVFSAADFEDFREPRPDLPATLEGELANVVRFLAEQRWPFRIHATYDESITRVLDVYEQVNREVPFDGLHWIVDHAETISPRNIERVRALGGGIAIQHRMAYQGEFFAQRYGSDALRHTPPVRRMLQAGVPVGAGTDATRVASYNPWVALYWLVSGRTLGGLQMYGDDNRLERQEALQLWTHGSAWFSTEQARKGRLAPGQFADCALLSADYFTVAEDDIPDITSVLTVVDGRIVHATGPFAPHAPALPAPMPDWSPVNRFGGYQGGTLAQASAALAHAHGPACRVHAHGHAHTHAAHHAVPTRDLQAFWGALGCACFAF